MKLTALCTIMGVGEDGRVKPGYSFEISDAVAESLIARGFAKEDTTKPVAEAKKAGNQANNGNAG